MPADAQLTRAPPPPSSAAIVGNVGAGFARGWDFTHTVAFETVFGHWVEGESWSTVLEQYDVRTGNVWVVVPAAIVVGPDLARRLSARQRGRQTLAHDRSKSDPPVKAAPR